jgi:hypothetical protein
MVFRFQKMKRNDPKSGDFRSPMGWESFHFHSLGGHSETVAWFGCSNPNGQLED